MTLPDLLQRVVAALDDAGIPYMLTGSVAAGWHGASRATMDIDLVVEPDQARLSKLLQILSQPGIYVPDETAHEALSRRTMFNVIDIAAGFKADLIIRKDRPFSRSEFDRRTAIKMGGSTIWIATVEDLILSKLEWARLGESHRQIEDAATLARIAGDALDRTYLQRWAKELGIEPELARLPL